MPALSVEMKAPTTRDQGLLPGDLAIDATFTNTTGDATYLNVHQASHPALVLEVRDARNELVRLAPPSAPDADDLAPGQELKPGESVSLRYAGFLDRGLAGGAYRVRYSSPYPALGGSPDDPLQSPWVGVMVRGDEHYASVAALERPWLVIVRQRAWVLSVLLRWWFLIWCFIRQPAWPAALRSGAYARGRRGAQRDDLQRSTRVGGMERHLWLAGAIRLAPRRQHVSR